MDTLTYKRIVELERRIERYENNPAPTVPIYDLDEAVPSPVYDPGGGGSAIIVTATPGPSSVDMPTTDLTGWTLLFNEDFEDSVPSGEGVAVGHDAAYFPQITSGKWTAYPNSYTSAPWNPSSSRSTPSWANYFPERTVSFHDHLMDIHIHDEVIGGTNYHLVAAMTPQVGGGNNPYLSWSRYEYMLKSDAFPGYHISNLLWPQTDDNHTRPWPAGGEVDYPECDFNDSSISAFVHLDGATSGGDAEGFNIATSLSDGNWHKYTLEFKAGIFVKIYFDDVLKHTFTNRIPVSPMRFVLQHSSSFNSIYPGALGGSSGHIYYDWLAVWKGTP